MNEEIKAQADKGYIKLIKNETSKGVISYAWEIKGFDDMAQATMDLLIERLNYLNGKMLSAFTSSGDL